MLKLSVSPGEFLMSGTLEAVKENDFQKIQGEIDTLKAELAAFDPDTDIVAGTKPADKGDDADETAAADEKLYNPLIFTERTAICVPGDFFGKPWDSFSVIRGQMPI